MGGIKMAFAMEVPVKRRRLRDGPGTFYHGGAR